VCILFACGAWSLAADDFTKTENLVNQDKENLVNQDFTKVNWRETYLREIASTKNCNSVESDSEDLVEHDSTKVEWTERHLREIVSVLPVVLRV